VLTFGIVNILARKSGVSDPEWRQEEGYKTKEKKECLPALLAVAMQLLPPTSTSWPIPTSLHCRNARLCLGGHSTSS